MEDAVSGFIDDRGKLSAQILGDEVLLGSHCLNVMAGLEI